MLVLGLRAPVAGRCPSGRSTWVHYTLLGSPLESCKEKYLLMLRFQLAVSPPLVSAHDLCRRLPLSSSTSLVSFAFLFCKPLEIHFAFRWKPDVLKHLI